jgi:SAM-dependent methyltransferase
MQSESLAPIDTLCIVCGGDQRPAFRRGEFIYGRCRACGLLSISPIPTAELIESHYHAKFKAGNYEAARRYASEYRRIYRQYADFISPKPGDRILDVGCFTGELIHVLAERGADVYGLELQAEAVAIANGRLPGRVYQADVFGTRFPAGPYDIVTMMGVIEHVTEPAAFLKRANELLKPGGELFLQTPDASSVVAKVTGTHWPPLAPVEHIHLFSRTALRHLLKHAGFSRMRFRCHVKRLPVAYVYENFANFGPEWRKVFKPVEAILGKTVLPFYGGEMMASATKDHLG